VDTGVLAYERDGRIVVEPVGGIEYSLPLPPDEGGILYLRVANHGATVGIVCQGGRTGTAWVSFGGLWTSLGPSFGQNAVEIVRTSHGFVVFVQTCPTEYDSFVYDLGGQQSSVSFVHTMPPTSQGFLDASVPELFLTDEGRMSQPGMVLPNRAGDLIVGQHTVDGMAGRYRGGPVFLVCPGVVFEPRVAQRGESYVCVSRSNSNTFLVAVCTPPFEPLKPEPVPEPTPEVPVPYTSIAPNRLDVVRAVHEEYPGLIHRPHDFTARVAARLHATDSRWGRNGKRGNKGDPSEDCVAFLAPGSPAGGVEVYDIISAANTPQAAPAWIDQTRATVDAGTIGAWVAPLVEEGQPQAPDKPAVPPGVPAGGLTETDLVVALAPVLSRLEALESGIDRALDDLFNMAARQEELADLLAGHVAKARGDLEVRLEAVAAAIAALPQKGCVLRR
jgi:hypothetical protein